MTDIYQKAYTIIYPSRLGDILLAADEIGLTGLWFFGQSYFADTLPAGLLRVRVQRKGQRNRKVLMEQMPLKKKVAKPALRRRVLCCSMMFLDFSRKGLFLP